MTAQLPSPRADSARDALLFPDPQPGAPVVLSEVGHPLPDSAQSPSLARGLLRHALQGFPAEVVDTALLLVSELVTNAVLHTQSPLILRIQTARPHVRVSVEDSSKGQPQARDLNAEAANGRGLWLVDAMATSWGWYGTATGGKRVWFLL